MQHACHQHSCGNPLVLPWLSGWRSGSERMDISCSIQIFQLLYQATQGTLSHCHLSVSIAHTSVILPLAWKIIMTMLSNNGIPWSVIKIYRLQHNLRKQMLSFWNLTIIFITTHHIFFNIQTENAMKTMKYVEERLKHKFNEYEKRTKMI